MLKKPCPKLIKIVLFVFLFTNFLLANEYKITSVISVKDKNYTRVRIILNNYLVIENIKFFKDGSIEFPSYEAANKSKYPQVVILDPNLEEQIIKSIKNYKETPYKFDLSKVVFRLNDASDIKNSKSRKANLELVLDEKILVVCGMMTGKKGPWISWPGVKGEDGYFYKHVYILNKNLKTKIEKFLLAKYKQL